MKIIKTDNYIKKAQGLPGDPGFPPGVTQRTIDEQAGGEYVNEDITGVEGEYYGSVNWDQFMDWYVDGGEDPDPVWEAIHGNVEVQLYFTYDYKKDYRMGRFFVSNVVPKSAKILYPNKNQFEFITDPRIASSLTEYLSNDIEEYIKNNISNLELPSQF